MYLLYSSSKALLDLRNHNDTKRCPLEVFLTISTTWAKTKKCTVLLFTLHSSLLFHLLPFLSVSHSNFQLSWHWQLCSQQRNAVLHRLGKRERKRVDQATQLTKEVSQWSEWWLLWFDLPAQSIHLWLAICVWSCKHRALSSLFPQFCCSLAPSSLCVCLWLATNGESSMSEVIVASCLMILFDQVEISIHQLVRLHRVTS